MTNRSRTTTRLMTTLFLASAATVATGCMVQADVDDEGMVDGGNTPEGGWDSGVGGGDDECGPFNNSELATDGTCSCVPGHEWCYPEDETSFACCPSDGGGDGDPPGESCGEGSNNELVGPDECACLPGFDWCNPDDVNDLNCCEVGDVVPCSSGQNNQVVGGDECACLPGFDWCDPDDVTSLDCCDPDQGDDTGDTGGDAFGCDGEMVVEQVNVARDSVWTQGSTCIVEGQIVVQPGATLTIEEGVIVKFSSSRFSDDLVGIEVAGRLVVQGSDSAKVIFTDIADDTAGGDTNGDGGATVPGTSSGGFAGLRFVAGSEGDVQHGEFRYVQGEAGIFVDRSAPKLRNLHFRNLEAENVSVGASDMPDISDLTVKHGLRNGVSVRGGNILGDVRWASGVARTILGDLKVGATGSLTVDPGSVIKFPKAADGTAAIGLSVEGMLSSVGTAEQPVVWTDERDDEFGGDSNQDGDATAPAAEDGSWLGISVVRGGVADFDYSQVMFANGEAGVSNRGQTQVYNTLIGANRVGLRGESPGTLTVRDSAIVGNLQAGALAQGDGAVDAVENWWGDASGPGGEGMGMGDSIGTGVLYVPFSVEPLR